MSRRSLISGTRNLTSFIFSNHHSFPKSPSSTIAKPLFNPNHILHHRQFHNPFQTLNSISNLNLPQIYTQLPSSMAPPSSLTQLHLFSTSSPPTPDPSPNPNPEMKHQEIEGPTVDPDLSPLANETREVTTSLLKTMYSLSKGLGLLGLAHLCFGICSYYSLISLPQSLLTMQLCGASAIAFGFPLSMAFMMRRSLKSMHFFRKMEQNGRLQVLTCSMQVLKDLRSLFFRVRVLSYTCIVALTAASSVSIYTSYITAHNSV